MEQTLNIFDTCLVVAVGWIVMQCLARSRSIVGYTAKAVPALLRFSDVEDHRRFEKVNARLVDRRISSHDPVRGIFTLLLMLLCCTRGDGLYPSLNTWWKNFLRIVSSHKTEELNTIMYNKSGKEIASVLNMSCNGVQ